MHRLAVDEWSVLQVTQSDRGRGEGEGREGDREKGRDGYRQN